MDESVQSIVMWIGFGYLLGSFPTGYVLVRLLLGEDIRGYGSGNTGATNVSRVLGKRWGFITAVCDISKGGVAVLLAMLAGAGSPLLLSLTGSAAVIGHDFPLWLGGRGGKGVATTFGVLACYDFFNPLPVLVGGVIWFLVREVSGYASLSSIVALLSASLAIPFAMESGYYFVSAMLLLALSVWRHRENITRLVSGTESRVQPFLARRRR
ncbi:MAG: glycerol-3-phosphate 1-O-acyltransferase PlsY [Synergistaceae bacterium]|jgi:glycerol-3-phosphate acyltransferase PlsY|nr:glycerol-3-phosphate 1-O-acyltransferase PlsY [Synergistaceae bacterium]